MTREHVIQETTYMTEASGPTQNKEDLTDAANDASILQNPITLPPGMTLLHTLRGHTRSIKSVAWSPDGELLASGADDKTLWLWNPTTGALLHGHTSSINSVAWSPTGEMLASGSN